MRPITPPATPARKAVRLWQLHNRRRWALEKEVLSGEARAPFVCECTSDQCVEMVELTMGEFEDVHVRGDRCAVAPGHVLPDDGGRVVVQAERYWVVELLDLPPG
jgi:hypothetical protein